MSKRLKDYQTAYEIAEPAWSPYLVEADVDIAYYLNNQWSTSEKTWLNENNRNADVFNRLKRIGKTVSGYERKNRLQMKVSPWGIEDSPSCNSMTNVLQHVMNLSDGFHTASDAFEMGSIVTGANMVEPWIDRDGDIQIFRWPHNSYLLDPSFTERDLSDCGFILTGKFITKSTAKMLFPGKDRFINKLKGQSNQGSRWGFMHNQPLKQEDDILLAEMFWERVTATATILIDRMNGAKKRFKGTKAQLEEILQAVGDRVAVIRKPISSVQATIFLEEQEIHHIKNPYGIDNYPHVPIMGYWYPESVDHERRLQGVLRSSRDAQHADNKRLNQILDIIETTIHSGWKYKEGALVDENSVYQSGQKKVIGIKSEFNLEDVQELKGPGPGQSLFMAQQMLDKQLDENAGVNNELFGTETKDVPGFLGKQRQGAALTTLQDLFDNLRLSKKYLTRVLVRMIQENFSPQKIQRITNEAPPQGFYDPEMIKFDCTPSEALLTDSQVQEAFIQAMSMKQMGAPMPWSHIMKLTQMPFRKQFEQAVQQEEQAIRQQQQVEQQMAMQKSRLEDMKTQSEIAANLGRAEERKTQSSENVTNARLNQAKTVAETQEINAKTLKTTAEVATQLDAATSTKVEDTDA
jgi:hypothetical protein